MTTSRSSTAVISKALRSARPRHNDVSDILNTRIKFGECFRPFAPSILEDALDPSTYAARFIDSICCQSSIFRSFTWPVRNRPKNTGRIIAVCGPNGLSRGHVAHPAVCHRLVGGTVGHRGV